MHGKTFLPGASPAALKSASRIQPNSSKRSSSWMRRRDRQSTMARLTVQSNTCARVASADSTKVCPFCFWAQYRKRPSVSRLMHRPINVYNHSFPSSATRTKLQSLCWPVWLLESVRRYWLYVPWKPSKCVLSMTSIEVSVFRSHCSTW